MNSLENMIKDIRSQSNVSIQLNINEPVRISDNSSALHLYRIAQEAVNNAIKHAGADYIKVTVGREGARGCLAIHDNGTGFTQPNKESTGLGLRIMRHRCGLIDAEIKIESSYAEGTEVKCLFPVENNSTRP